uniref:TRAP transporter small permease protein n=1 Tax=Paenirhodobacter populi TaxID=2306993 RepID=A0A443K351_9RHOB|nr:TRAP transporter small permease [Sinirhodobacter populi]RWR27184.1 TRAP transporter small permease [Sinirhodobacter populi]
MKPAFVLLNRSCLVLRRFFSAVVIVLFAVMLCSVMIQIAGRYLFGYSISAASEIATFAQIWLVLFGAGVALARGQHVAIDIFPAMLPRNLARVALLIISVVIVFFLGVLIYGSLPLIEFGKFQTSPALGIPMKWVYLAMPVAGFYMILEALMSCVMRWNDPFPAPDTDTLDEAA